MPVKTQPHALKDANDTTGDVVAVMNSGAVDRTGERIDPSGWDLASFNDSGVITLNHAREGFNDTFYGLPIAKRVSAWVDPSAGLLVHYKYHLDAPGKLGELAQAVYFLEKSGAMVGHSVWFEPFAWSEQDGTSGMRSWGDPYPRMPAKGRTYTKTGLVECGPVLIPAEPRSVTLTVKAFEDRGLAVPDWARSPAFQTAEEWRRALAGEAVTTPDAEKAGRVISAANMAKLAAAMEGMKRMKGSMGDCMGTCDEAMAVMEELAAAGNVVETDPADETRSRLERDGAAPGFDPLESLGDVLRSIDGGAIARRAWGN